MERFYDCINCMKTFKVSSATEPSAEEPEAKDECGLSRLQHAKHSYVAARSQVYPAKLAHYRLQSSKTR